MKEETMYYVEFPLPRTGVSEHKYSVHNTASASPKCASRTDSRRRRMRDEYVTYVHLISSRSRLLCSTRLARDEHGHNVPSSPSHDIYHALTRHAL